ncbi:MAG: hypothetical protein AMJ53_09650 [Gammaproteobacteria bacterium SG8_11]|nr:MAG: hypothetical protein AMJ53_09650 [Gammaproteobacteria bacterium SG8_11]
MVLRGGFNEYCSKNGVGKLLDFSGDFLTKEKDKHRYLAPHWTVAAMLRLVSQISKTRVFESDFYLPILRTNR